MPQDRPAAVETDRLASFEEFAGASPDYYSSTFMRLQLAGLPIGHLNLSALAGGFVWAALRANGLLFWIGLTADLAAAANAALVYRYSRAAGQAAADGSELLIPRYESLVDAHLIAAITFFLFGRILLGTLADRLYYRQYTRWRTRPSTASGLRPRRLVVAVLIVALIAPLTLYRASQAAPDRHSCTLLAWQVRDGGTAPAKSRFDCWAISEFPTLFWLPHPPEVSWTRNADGTWIRQVEESAAQPLASPGTFVSESADRALDHLKTPHGHILNRIAGLLQALLNVAEAVFVGTPWMVTALLLIGAAARFAGPRVAVFVGASLAYLAVFGFWQMAMGTVALVVVSTLLCAAAGFPLGVWAGKTRSGSALLTPVLDVMQTIPSFLYLLPAAAFFAIGKPAGILATVVFALPPMVRLTASGIRQVPGSTREAALALGANPRQLLVKVELPLALPSVLAGVGQTLMMSLSMVVIAAVVGAGGMGLLVVEALDGGGVGRGILAGIGIALIALMFDRVIRKAGPPRP